MNNQPIIPSQSQRLTKVMHKTCARYQAFPQGQPGRVQPLRRWLVWIVSWLLSLFLAQTAFANGVPVQVFLDHLPFRATWEPAAHGRGVAVLAANDEQVRVMIQNVPAPPPDQVYFAWLQKVDGSYLPVGALEYSTDGTASLDQHVADLPYSENFSWVLVTLESPEQVDAQPSDAIALAGRLPNAEALPPTTANVPALLPVTGGKPLSRMLQLVLFSGVLLGGGFLFGWLVRNAKWTNSEILKVDGRTVHKNKRAGRDL
ncbi:MAG: anti-sigma factor [Gammaproteobacteria bacterium]|nr:MAG: anti-sigma factor [Gammaproteobacteria bacterium]